MLGRPFLPSTLRSRALAIFGCVVVVGCTACGGSTSEGDAGDTGDSTAVPEAGSVDSGDSDSPDAGGMDALSAEPGVLFDGVAAVQGANVYARLVGTRTSTLPPLFVLPTGPHMGGIPAFFGNLGGGIGHEYLPEHMGFLEQGRLMLYFDFAATGRSGFGSIETSSVTAEAHVRQVENMVHWLREDRGISFERIDLIGHGYGGGIAALFAGDHPTEVDRLVLVAPMGLNIGQFSQSIVNLQGRLTSGDRERLDAYTRQPECRGHPDQCTLDVWSVVVPRMMCPSTEARATLLDFRFGDYRGYQLVELDLRERQFDWTSRVGRIASLTWVLAGACDVIDGSVALAYAEAISGSRRTVLSRSGHFPMVEAPEDFRALVGAALRRP